MLQHWMKIYLSIIYYVIVYATGENIPCASRIADSGYICVCNETYCDTIENPKPVKNGSFYHYTTSKTRPGFTMSIGHFKSADRSHYVEPSSDDFFFWVNASVHFQTLSGVGGGFTDTTGVNFNHLSPKSKEKFIESYYGQTGIEYTFGRVPIAGTDFSLRFYSYDDVPGDIDLKNFNLTDEDFSLKIPLIKMATNSSKRGVKLLSTPWTSPSWMKTNNGSKAGYLLSKYHRTWVNYLLKFLEAYSENGIDFWGISQGNEAVLGLLVRFQMPNLVMLPPQLKALTKYHFGPMFKQSPFKNVKILTLDDERPFTTWWDKSLLHNKDTAQYLDGVALHWYFDSEQNTNILDEHNRKYPDKFILYTESSIISFHSKSVALGSWDKAVRYIEGILQAYNHWSIGFIDWNLALDESGGPTYAGMHLDAAIIINTTSGEFYKQPTFYVLGHFSKFIQPGSIRVQIMTNNTVNKVDNYLKEFGNNKVGDPTPPTPTGDPTPPTPSGSPGPPPSGPPGPTTSSPPGPKPGPSPTPTSNIVEALATLNPDGSRTIIVHNPKSVPVNVILSDPAAGILNQTISACSINTFIYW